MGIIGLIQNLDHSFSIQGSDFCLFKTSIQFFCDSLFVEMLADKHDFLHSVSILGIPVMHQSGFLLHQLDQIFFWCCGIPETGFTELFLCAGLFSLIGIPIQYNARVRVDFKFVIHRAGEKPSFIARRTVVGLAPDLHVLRRSAGHLG